MLSAHPRCRARHPGGQPAHSAAARRWRRRSPSGRRRRAWRTATRRVLCTRAASAATVRAAGTADAVRLRVDRRQRGGGAGVVRRSRRRGAGVPGLRPLRRLRPVAREEPERFVLALCWAHARRDFVDATAGRPRLGKWSGRWLERIAALYRDNAERARRWDPGLPVGRQGAAFAKAQRARRRRPDRAGAAGTRRCPPTRRRASRYALWSATARATVLDGRAGQRRRAHPRRRDRPKLSFGSHSETGAELAGQLYSVFGTLALAGLRPYPWLADYLQACAAAGGRPPADARAWLPWGMDESNARRWRRRPAQGP